MSIIKDRILSKFPSVKVVARICGVTSGAVSQWDDIPARHQQALLDAGPEYNVEISPNDFFEIPINDNPPLSKGDRNEQGA